MCSSMNYRRMYVFLPRCLPNCISKELSLLKTAKHLENTICVHISSLPEIFGRSPCCTVPGEKSPAMVISPWPETFHRETYGTWHHEKIKYIYSIYKKCFRRGVDTH